VGARPFLVAGSPWAIGGGLLPKRRGTPCGCPAVPRCRKSLGHGPGVLCPPSGAGGRCGCEDRCYHRGTENVLAQGQAARSDLRLNQFASISRMLGQADQKPGRDAYERFGDLVKELDAVQADAARVMM